MNLRAKNPFGLPILTAVLGLILTGRVSPQTLNPLHNFTGGNDGASPQGGLVLSGNTLYGTASAGGSASNGAVFAVNTDGTGFTNLHSFAAYSGPPAVNSQRASQQTGLLLPGNTLASPQAGLILSGDTLYGTTHRGGHAGAGMVFALHTDGTGFTNLHYFTRSEGAEPQAGLILSGNTLYGTAHTGGHSDAGTVFALRTDGRGFTNLHGFTGGRDGANPQAGLILSGHALYGTTTGGGRDGCGTVFTVNTDGTGFKNLHLFTGRDGVWPEAGLVVSGNMLYGTTFYGGASGRISNDGIVFRLNMNGSGFTNLYSFTEFYRAAPYPNGDGARPKAELVLSGNTLYGTTCQGGNSGGGTVFALNTDGTGFTTLYSFAGGSDGANPEGGLILSNHTLYGTAIGGGGSSRGTVFSLSLGQ
jgi:uncharacterized repeat protein (TIGR03803 family)